MRDFWLVHTYVGGLVIHHPFPESVDEVDMARKEGWVEIKKQGKNSFQNLEVICVGSVPNAEVGKFSSSWFSLPDRRSIQAEQRTNFLRWRSVAFVLSPRAFLLRSWRTWRSGLPDGWRVPGHGGRKPCKESIRFVEGEGEDGNDVRKSLPLIPFVQHKARSIPS